MQTNELILDREAHTLFDMWFYKWGEFEVRIVQHEKGKFQVKVYESLYKDMFMPTLEGLPPLYRLDFPKSGIMLGSADKAIETINEYKRLLPVLEAKLKELAEA